MEDGFPRPLDIIITFYKDLSFWKIGMDSKDGLRQLKLSSSWNSAFMDYLSPHLFQCIFKAGIRSISSEKVSEITFLFQRGKRSVMNVFLSNIKHAPVMIFTTDLLAHTPSERGTVDASHL